MLTRKPTQSPGVPVPADWIAEYQEIIDQAYATQYEQKNSKIEVFGRLYKEELLIGFTLRDQEQSALIPYGLLLSFDLDDPKQVAEIRKDSIDIGAQFIDQCFMSEEKEYFPLWQQETHKKRTFHYKITREDFSLSIQADELLAGHSSN